MLSKVKLPKIKIVEYVLFTLSIIFSSWLMFFTFSYANGNMLIAAKAWSDFASHIPLIRSFSLGSNFPPEYPLFSGEPMRFHFLFYALVGLLEKIRVPFDYALNIPSSLGFTGLILIIYFFSKKLFKSTMVGTLSVIFFLFNGSLSFLFFFNRHPIGVSTLTDIIKSNSFSSFGPYDNNIVSAFWNLNIYTNQRHLGLAFALSLFLIYQILKSVINQTKTLKQYMETPKVFSFIFGERLNTSSRFLFNSSLLGILLSTFFYLHIGVFAITTIILLTLAIFFQSIRFRIIIIFLIGAIFSIPQYIYQDAGSNSFHLFLHPGYLITGKVTLISFVNYWGMNLGAHLLFMMGGFVLVPTKMKKIFISFFSLFLIGNLFQFSPEIAGNHKFFNFFMIIGVMFSSFFLVKVWKEKIYLKPVVILCFFFLILSGIIDFFPIYNDGKITLYDYPINKDINWIKNNTPSNSVFLNSQYLYDSASLAGRKIFLGWPYFAWSAGYDTNQRGELMKRILGEKDKNLLCQLLKQNKIDFIETKNDSALDPNYPVVSDIFSKQLSPVYTNNNYYIYKAKGNCKNI